MQLSWLGFRKNLARQRRCAGKVYGWFQKELAEVRGEIAVSSIEVRAMAQMES
jgi:hypothetical protein